MAAPRAAIVVVPAESGGAEGRMRWSVIEVW